MSIDATTTHAEPGHDERSAAHSDGTAETTESPTTETPSQRGDGDRLVRMAVAGAAGAATVTALNEAARRLVPHAPRMEVMGERALSRTMRAVSLDPPRGRALYRWT